MSESNPQAKTKKKPSVAGIIVSIALLVLGPVGGAAWIIVAVINVTGELSQAPVYSSDNPAAEIVVSGGSQEMALWTSGGGVNQCVVTDPSGGNVPLHPPSISDSTIGRYSLAATFTAPSDGVYKIDCTAADNSFKFKVAPSMSVAGLVGGILGGVLVIIVGMFAGAILLVVTLIRRSSWKRKNSLA